LLQAFTLLECAAAIEKRFTVADPGPVSESRGRESHMPKRALVMTEDADMAVRSRVDRGRAEAQAIFSTPGRFVSTATPIHLH
jgi:hypothetical protein